MDTEDVQIMREAEAVLVRNYVDTSRLNIEVINRSIYIDGFFFIHDYYHRRPVTKEGKTLEDSGTTQSNAKRILLVIEQQLRTIRDVGSIQLRFKNWQKTNAGWVEVAA